MPQLHFAKLTLYDLRRVRHHDYNLSDRLADMLDFLFAVLPVLIRCQSFEPEHQQRVTVFPYLANYLALIVNRLENPFHTTPIGG